MFKLATLEGVEMPPSLSKWIQKAIEERLEREGNVASPTAMTALPDKTLNGGASA